MSSRYQKPYTIPEEFPPLLKQFTREVLREQPENLYAFGATYFKKLLELKRDEERKASRSVLEMTSEEIQEYIQEIFLAADSDANGFLDRREMKVVLDSANLGLTKKEMREVMTECDENEDGYIEYNEFIPIMVQIMHSMKAKEAAAKEAAAQEDDAHDKAEAILIKGLYEAEFFERLKASFLAADKDKSGLLDRREFKSCLKYSGLGLTKKEINLLMSEADYDGDGLISWEEFSTTCYEILVWHMTNELLHKQRSFPQDELTAELLLMFESGDEAKSGFLHQSEIKAYITEYSYELLGLTSLQISVVMSETNPDKKGMVDYTNFANKAAHLIYTFIDYESQYKRTKAVVNLSKVSGSQLLRGLDKDTVTNLLMQAFVEHDTDNSGTLDREEAYYALEDLGTGELQLRPKEISALMGAMDEDQDGKVTYSEFIDFMYDVLQHLEREEYIQDVAFDTMMEAQEEAAAAEAAAEAPQEEEAPAEAPPAAEEEPVEATPAEEAAPAEAAPGKKKLPRNPRWCRHSYRRTTWARTS